jgi:hypothetical protein
MMARNMVFSSGDALLRKLRFRYDSRLMKVSAFSLMSDGRKRMMKGKLSYVS